jgi:hypothetical protein
MISRMNDEVRTISSGRDGSWFAVKSNRSETSAMFRIFVTLCLLVGAAPTPAGETLRIGLQRTGTFAWQLDVIRRHRGPATLRKNAPGLTKARSGLLSGRLADAEFTRPVP